MEISTVIDILENGKVNQLIEYIKNQLDAGVPPQTIINEKLIIAIEDIGERFKKNELFIPEVLIVARTMNHAINYLAPHLETSSNEGKKIKVVLGTVKGDLHDIGKNLVAMSFKSNYFDVIDLGIDVSEEAFVTAVKDYQPHVLALSALLTNTLNQMEVVVERLKEEGLRDQVKVIVGGAPVSEEFSQSIGADGYAPDSVSGVSLVKKLLNK